MPVRLPAEWCRDVLRTRGREPPVGLLVESSRG